MGGGRAGLGITHDLHIVHGHIRGHDTDIVTSGSTQRDIMDIHGAAVSINIGGAAEDELSVGKLQLRSILVADGDAVAAEHHGSTGDGRLTGMLVQQALVGSIIHDAAAGDLQITGIDDAAVEAIADLAVGHHQVTGIFDAVITCVGNGTAIELQIAGLADLDQGVTAGIEGDIGDDTFTAQINTPDTAAGQRSILGGNGQLRTLGNIDTVTDTVCIAARIPGEAAAFQHHNIVVSAGNDTAVLGQSAAAADTGILLTAAGDLSAGDGSSALIEHIVSLGRSALDGSVLFHGQCGTLGHMDRAGQIGCVDSYRAFYRQLASGRDNEHIVIPCPLANGGNRSFADQDLITGNLNRGFQDKILIHGNLQNRGIRHLLAEITLGNSLRFGAHDTATGSAGQHKDHEQTDQECSIYAFMIHAHIHYSIPSSNRVSAFRWVK